MKIVWQSVVSIIFVVLLIVIQILYWINPVTLSDVLVLRDQLFLFIQQFPAIAVFIYTSVYTLSIVFGIPISTTILGGYFFGTLFGFIYSFIAIILGTISLCVLARYVMRDWIEQRYKKELEPLNKEIKKYGIYYLLMIHAMPFMPSFLPHIAAGLSSIALYKIILVNIIGSFPLTLLYTVAGAYLHELDSLQVFIFYATIFGLILGLLFIAMLTYRRFLKQ